MKIHIIITTIFILLILNAKANLAEVSICGGIYFLSEVSFVLKQLMKQKEEIAERTLRSNEAIALDLLAALRERQPNIDEKEITRMAEEHADTKWSRDEEIWTARKFGFIQGVKTILKK